MPAAELRRRLATVGLKAEAQPEAAVALRRALELTNEDEMVLVAGSVFLVEQVREGFGPE
jgi:folylpolyglutamate synthase/dihydropteroate synthase